MGIARYEKRVCAYLIDEVLACLIGVAVLIVFLHFGIMDDSWFLNTLLSAVLAYGAYILIVTLCNLIFDGRTLGFAIFGIRAIHEDGRRLGFGDALIRGAVGGVLAAMAVEAIFMLHVHSELSPIDRMSQTKVIDVRRG